LFIGPSAAIDPFSTHRSPGAQSHRQPNSEHRARQPSDRAEKEEPGHIRPAVMIPQCPDQHPRGEEPNAEKTGDRTRKPS